jgi:hypothetical protein
LTASCSAAQRNFLEFEQSNSNDWENLKGGCLKLEQSVRKNRPIRNKNRTVWDVPNEIEQNKAAKLSVLFSSPSHEEGRVQFTLLGDRFPVSVFTLETFEEFCSAFSQCERNENGTIFDLGGS